MRRLPVVALLAILVAGCGGGSNVVTRGGSTPPPGTSPPASSSSAAGPRHPAVRVTPAQGLRDHQVVMVHATGFAAGEALTVIECAARGDATGPGDCNLAGMLAVSADETGRVDTRLTVLRGPFGTNHVVCSAGHPCLVSVTQASLSPKDEADTPISFATR